ncbi:MAG: hypothetical protein PVF45_08345 [Anaerolineae bacterium]|jgi:hypothetical protein
MLRDAVIDFDRGPYGEIFSPPLVAGLTMEETLAWLERVSEDLGSPIVDMPSKGRSREGMEWMSVVHATQLRLRQAVAGELPDDPDAGDLYRAVVVEGQPLSLRPLGQEDLTFAGFAPVLQHIAGDRWRIGVEGQGRTTEIVAPPDEVIRRAQGVYVRWSEADDAAWDKRVGQAMRRLPRSLMHQYWAWKFHRESLWERGGGYLLLDPAGHGTRLLDLPKGRRILRTNRLRAVHITDTLARRDRVEPPWPQVDEVVAWLEQEGVSPLEQSEGEWQSGPLRVAWERRGGGPPSARFSVGDASYAALVVGRKEITLHPTRRGRPDRKRKLATTAMEPPLREWLRDERGRAALAMWAIWDGELLDEPGVRYYGGDLRK